ncbi:type II toxin-antitoxin system ParD family antitoxin [uncultured Devosia sp.]|uniref:ribbon-helix-helix domain-containing protein n=1 Tax=uncultured Devosia sp. TaxID=211434 RepID=UPI0035CB07FA
MSTVKKRTFSVTAEQSAFIDMLVARGGHASGSEVVREGLRLLKQHDREIEQWLQREVIPTYDRWKAGLEETFTEDEVFAELRKTIDDIADERNAAASKAAE